jgi:hypothetical protein
MPTSNVTVRVEFEQSKSQTEYTIAVNAGNNGQIAHYSLGNRLVEGAIVLIFVEPNEGYYMASLNATTGGANGAIELYYGGDGMYMFIMPASNVTINGTFAQITSGLRFTITVNQPTGGGQITANPSGQVAPGTEVTVTGTHPNKDFYLADIDIRDANNISLISGGGKIDGGDNFYTFTMPYSNVTISGTFEEGGGGGPTQGSITISFDQISDVAKDLIIDQEISRSGAGGKLQTVELRIDGTLYTNITWNITGTGVTGSGPEFILDATNPAYNALGQHFLTLFVWKDGKPYNKTIIFTVVE